MINITKNIIIPDEELKEEFFLASGSGGQHVNKVATAVRLRYNVRTSKVLPSDLQQRLLDKYQARITSDGEILIEARRSRNREKNRLDAAERLKALILNFLHPPKKRRPSKPTYNSVKRRIESKKKHGANKKLRAKKPSLD
ncbi:MAG: aminoacyl-tRNA hydrolase [Victivallales bacterium]|nr:aminoacyl-tRNA hydrolase [Victivallales bacterium]